MFHNERFVFDNPYSFEERMGQSKYFAGEGDFTPTVPGSTCGRPISWPDLGASS